jgi:hypothetical protein
MTDVMSDHQAGRIRNGVEAYNAPPWTLLLTFSLGCRIARRCGSWKKSSR